MFYFSYKYILLFFVLVVSCSSFEQNNLKMPKIFSDGLIIQRDTTVAIWGYYKPNEKIKISCTWGFDTTAFSDSSGYWKTNIKTINNFDEQEISVFSAKESINIKNVLMGEVWLAVGQSNMEMNFDYCCNSTDSSAHELKYANYPKLRMYNVKKAINNNPQVDTEGKWVSAIGRNIVDFSAVGYFFAKNLYFDLNVPIGIINASWGGSIIESWTSNKALLNVAGFTEKIEEVKLLSSKYQKTKDWYSKLKSIPVPSGPMDLLLDELFPDIGYMDFFLSDWKKLDYLGQKEIKSTDNWIELDSTNSITHIVNDANFSGVVLFKNHFYVNEEDKSTYQIKIKPDLSRPWGLWEYDIYVNGDKVASSLINLNGDNYVFDNQNQTYVIDDSIIKNGKNSIVVRVLGYSRLGLVSVQSLANMVVPLISNWKVKIIAEESYQTDNYIYPYTSYYMNSSKEVKYPALSKKHHLTSWTTSGLYNGMIHPLLDYKIKGIVWYQGETNIERGGPDFKLYKQVFPLMVKDLRQSFGKDTPFYFAQIANYFNYHGMLKYFRQAQKELSNIENTGMVVTLDIGENYDIHPSNKHDVGHRFALLALNKVYDKNVIDSGPIFDGIEKEGKYLNLNFTSTGSGLKIINNKNTSIEVAGGDKKYFFARAEVYKNIIQIHSDKVTSPKYVRYAWSDTARATIFNKEGLPSAPFNSEFKNFRKK